MIKKILLLLTVLISVLSFSCSGTDPLVKSETVSGSKLPDLQKFYKKDFKIGAAIEPSQLEGAEGMLLRRHFNSITAENKMKFISIHPEPDKYNFAPADGIADFCRKYKIQMRGHTFVWHHQDEIANWMFFSKDGKRKSREEALLMLENHIKTLMDRYGDVVYAWDVVNEAIDISQPDKMRRTPWYDTIGPDYVEKAFEIAHKINPNARLFYNDYMTFDAQKGEAIYNFVKKMKDRGIPVDGIGMQMHLTLTYPDLEAIDATIEKFSQLGIEIHITELDMSLYTQEFETLDRAPEEYLIHQAHRYQELFKIFRNHNDVITSVTFWGFTDGHTWLTQAPNNRPDWPLPFDSELKPKLAYNGIVMMELPEDIDLSSLAPKKVYSARKGSPVIDGKIDKIWQTAEKAETATQVMSKPGATASVRVLWDKDRLYFLAEVKDPLLNNKSGMTHERDSFEIFIDENNGRTSSFEDDDYQIRVAYDGEISYGGSADLSLIKSSARITPSGYIVEISVKLQTISPENGKLLGLDFQVNDADKSAKRVGISKWNDPSNESWRNTSAWGILKLVE
ncbi:MAG: endo-1,4-beta-xylanase [Spirochaetes bacterium]|nr:endo-1,4-beta-xylanase [Spirochaetota bacterium]